MSNRGDTALSWLATGLFCVYCIFAYMSLNQNIRYLMSLSGVPVELPSSTRFIITTWPGLYWCILGGSAAFVLMKEILVKDKKRSLAITSIVAVLVLLIVNWMSMALFAPFARLMEKLTH